MSKKILFAFAVVFLMLIPCTATSAEDPGEDNYLLLDMGNGVTYWKTISGGSDAVTMVEDYAKTLNLEFEKDGSTITKIGEMAVHEVGTQECRWQLYKWSGTAWSSTTTTTYSSGSIAWGFYPEGLGPNETPTYRTSWIQWRGDSASSGVSDSYGTPEPKTPVEWYKTYRTGYVDSSIIVAGEYLYHTTYGETTSEGARAHAYFYCVNRLTSEMNWKFDLTTGDGIFEETADNGYNITSPVVIGDMIVINSATSHSKDGKTAMATYLLNRYTGEVIDYELVLHDPPVNKYGMPVWNGKTFINGGTSIIYDSGAIYFGTSDGRILSYSVSKTKGLELLWEYAPPSDVSGDKYIGSRGSIYYYSPIIVDVEGTRMLFIGNYEGYAIAVNASTGESIWEEQFIPPYNPEKSLMPGAVDLITYIGDGKLVIICSDGEMSHGMGFMVCVDAKNGMGPDGSDFYWRIDGVFTGTVPVGNGDFVAFVQKSTKPWFDTDTRIEENGIYRMSSAGQKVWRVDANLISSRMTIADGLIYYSEYSAGYFSDGGHAVAIKAADGSQVWSIRLEPYSKSSYSMVAPTVVDGKIYVANDYGAIYCISEIQGKKWDGGGEIILPDGFWHWSWYLLIAASAIAIFVVIRYY